ncbi:MAG: PCI domain-containing protein [Candidatus Heimdallarchaeaceae archaeon]
MKEFYKGYELDPFVLDILDENDEVIVKGKDCPFRYETYTNGKKLQVTIMDIEKDDIVYAFEVNGDINKINALRNPRSTLYKSLMKKVEEHHFPREHLIDGKITAKDVTEQMIEKIVKECYEFSLYERDGIEEELEEEEEEEELTEEEKKEIFKFIEEIEKDPIKAIYNAYEYLGVVGENFNKIVLFLLTLAGSSIQIRGESSSGKTFLANQTQKMFPKSYITKIGAMTDKALLRKDWEKIRQEANTKRIMIYIQEMLNGNNPETDMILRLLCNPDDDGIFFESTEKIDDRWETVMKYIPSAGLITTTTNLTMDHETATRTWIITIDDSEEQTKKIKEYYRDQQLGIPKQKEEKLRFKAFKIWVKKLLELQDVETVNPFSHLFISPDLTRTRRDDKKFFQLAGTIAKLFFNQRMKYELEEKTYLIVEPADMQLAAFLIEEIFKQTITEQDLRLQRDFERIKKLIEEEEYVTKHEIAKLIGKHWKTAMRNIIRPLCDMGCLYEKEHPVDKRKTIYEIGIEGNISYSVEDGEYYELFNTWLQKMEFTEIHKQLELIYPEILDKSAFLARRLEYIEYVKYIKNLDIWTNTRRLDFSSKNVSTKSSSNNLVYSRQLDTKNKGTYYVKTTLEKVLDYIKTKERVSIQELSVALGLSTDEAEKILAKLAERGMIVQKLEGLFEVVLE